MSYLYPNRAHTPLSHRRISSSTLLHILYSICVLSLALLDASSLFPLLSLAHLNPYPTSCSNMILPYDTLAMHHQMDHCTTHHPAAC
ncbi:hypothetical protein PYCCODRAFT_105998 [Trametes coccinea BRFM310]|uniref:Uncharacterized protein n=1 Tax=Trametes coccinea (strain BRFM310) TaxID=1353009 RepID=A0A1Y2ITS7_TRAC3|nr:hypothetical protein PYCCODRAFT_105998 [Trametes coccinea BRFM310]